MEAVVNFLSGFNIQTIIALFFIVWYFSSDVKRSVENLDRDMRDINTRISRVEGTIYGKNSNRLNKD